MRLGRWMMMLTAWMLLTGCALAEETPQPTVTPAPLYAPADITQEEIHDFVELLFAAAAGTAKEVEVTARAELSEEEIAARNAQNAEYRAKVLPWLIAVFKPEIPPEEIAQPTFTPEPTSSPEPAAMVSEDLQQIVYTTQDSYEAFSRTQIGREYLALLEGMGADCREMGLLVSQEICEMWMNEVDHEKLAQMNGDYRCWIYAPGTQIDYPIVQCEDNSYYLKRMFNRERNSAGTLFIDYRNLPDFQDPNTLIYGHHMRNDSMFGTLTDYARQEYFEAHPFMLVMAEKKVFILEIFAGYVTSDKDHCYDIAISDEEDMQKFLQEAERKSDFNSGVAVQTTEQLVTLSTCAYAFEDARYILIGRIVPVWAYEWMQYEEMNED